MNNICIIPARMGSSRFPGKPLFKINGKELVKHVYDNCIKSTIFQKVVIATPDKDIIDFCNHINADSILTSNEHTRASDRCHEAILNLEKQRSFYNICTMVQGDEPMVKHNVIDKITYSLIKDKNILCANGYGQIREEELTNKNCIKVLKDKNSNAIYMSRSPIPWEPIVNKNVGKQICVIPFQTHFLKTYSNLEPTPLEINESIDMLRVIENGKDVKMVSVDGYFHPVDILGDVKVVENLIKNNSN